METVVVKNANGAGYLEFFARVPPDPALPIDDFSVKVVDQNLVAAGEVYGSVSGHPAQLFADFARQWKGWDGELLWESLEGEFCLSCTNDRRGHIAIHVQLRSGPMEWDWVVRCTIMVEAGQLDSVARQVALFFGQHP